MISKLKPEFVYTTYSGTLYNLTPENQASLGINNVHFIFGDLLRMAEILTKLPPSLSPSAFYNFTGKKIFVSSIDSTVKRSRGCEDLLKVEIDNFGFKKVSNEEYLKISSLLRPDILVSLTEEGRQEAKGKKSLRRNVQKSLKFLSEAIEWKKNHNEIWGLYAPWQGGFYGDLRKVHLDGIEHHGKDIDGIVIHGLYDKVIAETPKTDGETNGEVHTNGVDDIFNHETNEHKLRKMIISLAREVLRDEKRIFVASDGNPLKVLELIREGADSFEASFPFHLARAGKAWIFEPLLWAQLTSNLIEAHYLMPEETVDAFFQESQALSPKVIDLNDKNFSKNLLPLVPGCTCYACQNFTCAYIQHLLAHHEMTANVLLSIHNCHLYRCFFDYLGSEEFKANSSRAIFTFFTYFTEKSTQEQTNK
jgi:queuine tRNA-ribosyltransferase subunit QTRTD1